MATQSRYVIWDRAAKTLLGGSRPLIFAVSADATAQALIASNKQTAVDDKHRFPAVAYDIITVQINDA